jgi:transposase, IS5 family
LQGINNIVKKPCNLREIIMLGKNENNKYLFNDLESMLDPKQALYLLSNKIDWDSITEWFKDHYSKTGRPSKNIRLMVSLLILKRIYNLGDETIVESWVQNPYMQYFSGEKTFQWKMPCDPSDLVHFRKRIGKEGIEKIFEISIDIHGNAKEEKEISVDTTVQEKNITFPTDVKLYKKIYVYCIEIAKKENIKLRQSYTRTIKKLIFLQRGRKTKKGKKAADKAKRHLKTISGRLIRELYRKLVHSSLNIS